MARVDYEHIKEAFAKRGFYLKSDSYTGQNEPLLAECSSGHRHFFTWKNFNRTKSTAADCRKCREELRTNSLPRTRKRKYTAAVVEECLRKEGYRLLTPFVSSSVKVEVCCPQGHVSSIFVSNFIAKGNRCFECRGSKKYTLDYIKRKCEEEGYKVLSDEYKGVKEKLKLLCPEGHEYSVSWDKFNGRGHRCSTCSGKAGLSLEEAKKSFLDKGYTLLDGEYKTALDTYSFICSNGHKHRMSLTNLRAGQSCGMCFREFEMGGSSKPEIYLAEVISQKFDTRINDRELISPYELDVYVPEKKTAIEYCGLYWHSDSFKDRDYHYKKRKACEEKGVRLITIFEDEFLQRPEVVLSRIWNSLGVVEKRVYARNTRITQISNKEARVFLENYHLQGAGLFSTAYGLVYKGDLVSVITGGKVTRKHAASERSFELKRLASVPGTVVVGGASKLFSRLVEHTSCRGYNRIISYCDLRWSSYPNTIYDILGFVKVRESKYTPHYFKGQKRYRNYTLRKTPEERNSGKTEMQLRREQGYRVIWDCGHASYSYDLTED